MHLSIFNFVLMVIGSAVFAGLGVFLNAARRGKYPSDYGSRSVNSEFLGNWIAYFFFILSTTVYGTPFQWVLFVIAMAAWITGLSLSAYFANTPEVSETPDEKQTGFKNDSTILHLN